MNKIIKFPYKTRGLEFNLRLSELYFLRFMLCWSFNVKKKLLNFFLLRILGVLGLSILFFYSLLGLPLTQTRSFWFYLFVPLYLFMSSSGQFSVLLCIKNGVTFRFFAFWFKFFFTWLYWRLWYFDLGVIFFLLKMLEFLQLLFYFV